METRWIDIKEFEELYHKIMPQDFTEAEAKSFDDFKRLDDRGLLASLVLEDQGQLMAYLVISESLNTNAQLIEYLAVSRKVRGQGVGSKLMSQYLDSVTQRVYLESEDPMSACNEADQRIRERRLNFYQRLGFKASDFLVTLYDDCYQILYYDPKDRLSPMSDAIKKELLDIYKIALPKEDFHSPKAQFMRASQI